MQQDRAPSRTHPDVDKYRLRAFVERLAGTDEIEVHDAPVPLIAMGARLDGNPRAVLFRQAGPERVEVVGNVVGSRSRIAAAFGVEARAVPHELLRRLAGPPQAVVEIPSAAAPVHQVVLAGDEADLTALPVHLQHAGDGGPYISASIDFSVDPDTKVPNVGIRRLMLRGPREAGIDLVAPSDLRAIYLKAAGRGEPLPVSFAVGCHPLDFVAAALRWPATSGR